MYWPTLFQLTLFSLMHYLITGIVTQQDPSQALPGQVDPRNYYLLETEWDLLHTNSTFHIDTTTPTGALTCGPGILCVDGSCLDPRTSADLGPIMVAPDVNPIVRARRHVASTARVEVSLVG
jgi:hypothetical protein